MKQLHVFRGTTAGLAELEHGVWVVGVEWKVSSDAARAVSKGQIRRVLLVKDFTLKAIGNLWKV